MRDDRSRVINSPLYRQGHGHVQHANSLPAERRSATAIGLHQNLNIRRTVTSGYVIVGAFFLTFGIWAMAAPISNAAIAPAAVITTGNNKAVQHLEGGIVASLMATEGDVVSFNQPLITLDATELRSIYDNTLLKLLHANAEYSRWRAEFRDESSVSYLSATETGYTFPTEKLEPAIQTQSTLFAVRRASFMQSLRNLDDRISQASIESDAANRRLRTLKRQFSLVSQEHGKYKEFESQGLVTRSKVFDLEQQKNNIALEVGETRDNTTVLKDKISQLKGQRQELQITNQEVAAQNMSRLQSVIDRTQPEIRSLERKLDRLVIRAPIDGRIINLSINATGSVIDSGQVIMEIVPTGEELLVVSRVSPQDRDTVSVGQLAEIRFNAFDRRSSKPIEGRVKSISADSIVDPITQIPYYKTTVEPHFSLADTIKPTELFPGMEAEVLIITGEQTLLQYLLGPITRSFNRALRES